MHSWIHIYMLNLFLVISQCSSAQLLDSLTLANEKTFSDLNDAIQFADKVYKLELKHKRLKTFPTAIFKFKNLQVLILRKNEIREVPKEIEQLASLQDLDLSGNLLEQLPDEICNLSNLKYLRLGQNELWELPDSIGKLQSMIYLDLWSNNLTSLPESISELSNLKEIDMRVIQLNEQKQNEIQSLLPHVKIKFSSPCDCDH